MKKLNESVITYGVWDKVSKLKQQYIQQGMEPEEAQEEAAEKLGVNPEELAAWLEDDQTWEEPGEIDDDLAYRISYRAKELQKKYRMDDREANEEAAEELGVDPEAWEEWVNNNADDNLWLQGGGEEERDDVDDIYYQRESSELDRMKELAGLSEGFDPEHFDEQTQIEVTSPSGTKYSDVAISYTATIVDGKPVVHPRSIVAKRTDSPVAFTKQMTEIVLQDQQAMASIQQHADQAWSERDNSEQGGDMSAAMADIEARMDQLMDQGMEPEDARAQAAQEAGVGEEDVLRAVDPEYQNESAELSRMKDLAGLR